MQVVVLAECIAAVDNVVPFMSGADVAMLYPDDVAAVVEEFDAIKPEISSWPLSGRTRDDEPTCTVFAYEEMYLGRMLEDNHSVRTIFELTNSASLHSSWRHPSS